ncbi:MAG TPA: hypothetical protein VKA51_02270 [Rubrobacteraceae bacterium]|nr:hypothetical protein [Rubrobacteraceae bacterium]
MDVSEYAKHDATGLAGLISTGRASAEDVRQAALRAVGTVNPELNAPVTVRTQGGAGEQPAAIPAVPTRGRRLPCRWATARPDSAFG